MVSNPGSKMNNPMTQLQTDKNNKHKPKHFRKLQLWTKLNRKDCDKHDLYYVTSVTQKKMTQLERFLHIFSEKHRHHDGANQKIGNAPVTPVGQLGAQSSCCTRRRGYGKAMDVCICNCSFNGCCCSSAFYTQIFWRNLNDEMLISYPFLCFLWWLKKLLCVSIKSDFFSSWNQSKKFQMCKKVRFTFQ